MLMLLLIVMLECGSLALCCLRPLRSDQQRCETRFRQQLREELGILKQSFMSGAVAEEEEEEKKKGKAKPKSSNDDEKENMAEDAAVSSTENTISIRGVCSSSVLMLACMLVRARSWVALRCVGGHGRAEPNLQTRHRLCDVHAARCVHVQSRFILFLFYFIFIL